MKNVMIISKQQAKKQIKEGDCDYLIDVRSEDEYAMGHIPSAVNIPLDRLETEISNVVRDKDQIVIVYCHSGMRSAVAAEILSDLGYKRIFDMGGIIDWIGEIVR